MRCPHCGDEHSDDAEFCPITGQSLKIFAGSSISCPNCKGLVPPDTLFCPICGAAMEGATGTGLGVLYLRKLLKGNVIKFVGIVAIIIAVILVIITNNGKWQNSGSSQQLILTLTQIPSMTQQASNLLLVTKTGIPVSPSETLPPTPTQTIPQPSPQPARQVPTPFPTMDISCPGAPPIRVEVGDLVRSHNHRRR